MMVGKDTKGHFNFVVSVETCFVTYMASFGEGAEEKVFCLCVFGRTVPWAPVRYIWSITSVSFIISLFSFCLNDLSIGESWMLMTPTVNVWGSMCDLIFSNVSFTNLVALAFGAEMFRIEMSSSWILFP